HRYPLLRQVCRFTTHERDPLDLLAAGVLREPPDRAFVCVADEAHALKIAITADRYWRGDPRSVVVRLDQLAAFRLGLFDPAAGPLRPYGVVHAAGDPDLIGQDLVERLARVIHDRYRIGRLWDRESRADNPFLVPWERLPPALRGSNRAQAEDIGRKLRAVGCVLVPRGPAA